MALSSIGDQIEVKEYGVETVGSSIKSVTSEQQEAFRTIITKKENRQKRRAARRERRASRKAARGERRRERRVKRPNELQETANNRDDRHEKMGVTFDTKVNLNKPQPQRLKPIGREFLPYSNDDNAKFEKATMLMTTIDEIVKNSSMTKAEKKGVIKPLCKELFLQFVAGAEKKIKRKGSSFMPIVYENFKENIIDGYAVILLDKNLTPEGKKVAIKKLVTDQMKIIISETLTDGAKIILQNTQNPKDGYKIITKEEFVSMVLSIKGGKQMIENFTIDHTKNAYGSKTNKITLTPK